MSALRALGEGFRTLGRAWGLAVVLLLVNVAVAALLAVPLAGALEEGLEHRDSARRMLYGFDFPWWSHWSDSRTGWTTSFGPEILGVGFAFRNLDLLLKGYLPLGLFAAPRRDDADAGAAAGAAAGPEIDPVILGVGAAYLLLQVFLAGGVLSVLRGAQGVWTARSLLHGSGFYFGRFVRIALLALAVDWLIFRLNAPLARWVDHQARESVSESGAMAWLLGRHALLLLALLFVHLVSSYAKVITVLEERSSALLAMLSSLSFCLRHLLRAAGQYLVVALLGLALLALWHALDSAWTTTGYKTQLVTLLLAEALVLGRIALRLGLLGGQLALYRRLSAS